MSTDDFQAQDPVTAAAEDETPLLPPTGFEALRRKTEEVQERHPQDFDIPGYDGMLVARYRIISFDDARAIGKKHRRQDNPRWLLNSQIDTLIEACMGMFYRDDDGKLVPLGGEGEPIRFDIRLAEGLGFAHEVETARQIVMRLFSNDIAIVDHHNDVMEWMRTGRKQDDAMGES